jgi:class 3 adenylate cyclase/tetratricopeptide (TPR) repeat protein
VGCPSCGEENPVGNKFCAECGASLAKTCPECGTAAAAESKFCGECGTALGASLPVAARPSANDAAPATERRLVSVLFADLVGFTPLSESRDAEDVRDLLSRYFDVCSTVISRYGGIVEKFIGDAVMAVWGTPIANEDDAERAVRAALELTQAVTSLGEEVGAPHLRARAGVLTGEAAVNLGAEGQGMVAGDLVNTAARIQSAAEPGSVLVGEATRHATEAAIAYEHAADYELKGKAELVRLSRALRVVGGRGGALRPGTLEAPFVGRDRELRLVKEAFHVSAEDGKAHVVSVTGIAGIGKSRLAWEFEKYIDGLTQTVRWHRGRSLSYGDGVTYWALAEMIRMRTGIVEGEDAASARGKLRATVEEHLSEEGDRRFVEPRLAHLLGLEDRIAPDKTDLFAGWRLFFERMAAQHPTVLVFEDMQWADSSLVEFLEYLLEWSRNFPLFVLTLARPEIVERHPSWGTGRRSLTALSLEPLSDQAMTALLDGLVPGLPETLGRAILSSAEGVPLYAVETVRMLIDRGLLIAENGVYLPVGEITALEVPETLHALIAARLDGLGVEERRVVQDASVLGKVFTREGLSELSGLAESALDPILAALTRKEVVAPVADPSSPERGQYAFLQDLVRTVAYETLAKRDRRAKHLATAEWLGMSGYDPDEVSEVLASHYLEAYQLAPDAPDAEGVRRKAREALNAAGERAASLAAAGEAEAFFERAAELSEDALGRASLIERAGEMAFMRGHLDEAMSRYDAAVQLFEREGEQRLAAATLARAAEVDSYQGRVEHGVDRMQRAYQTLNEREDAILAGVTARLGLSLALLGRNEEAFAYLEKALGLAEALELPRVYAEALNGRAIALQNQARFDEATTILRRAFDFSLEHGLVDAALRSANNLAEGQKCLNRFDEAVQSLDKGLGLARRVGNRSYELLFLTSADPLVWIGRWDEALEQLQLARETDGFDSMEWARSSCWAWIALVDALRGDSALADAALDELTKTETDNPEWRAVRSLVSATVFRMAGKLEAAVDAFEEALRGSEEIGPGLPVIQQALAEALDIAIEVRDFAHARSFLDRIDALRPGERSPYLRAELARLRARRSASEAGSDDGEVEEGFMEAEEGFRAIGTPFYLARGLLEHAEWLVSRDRDADAAPFLAEASEIFDRLRAIPWLDRVARLSRTASNGVANGHETRQGAGR